MPLISEYARRFGVYDNLLPVLSMSLGAGETTLMKMTNAYSMLVNGGKQVRCRRLIDRIQDRYGTHACGATIQRECPECRDPWLGRRRRSPSWRMIAARSSIPIRRIRLPR